MTRVQLLFLAAVAWVSTGCEPCNDAYCEDALLLTLRLPPRQGAYVATVETDVGSTTCPFEVPVPTTKCGNTDVAFLERGQEDYSVRLALPKTTRVRVVVERAGEVLITAEAAPRFEPDTTTESFCMGPCSIAQASVDVPDEPQR